MTDLATMLSADRPVDATQALGPVAHYETDPGDAREIETPEHAGKHLDAPAHSSVLAHLPSDA
jgi:hypothetical protein